MKAIGYKEAGSLQLEYALQDFNLDRPQAHGRDLLVKVAAVSVNPVDTKIRANSQPADGLKVLGWDAVGEVVATGELCDLFKVGDKVWYAGDLTRSGSNAEYQLVDERIVGHKPQSLSNAQAAAAPLTAITAWELLFDRLGFQVNGNASQPLANTTEQAPTLLIVGAAGGVGSILSQLAANLTNATVIGTASRAESQQWLADLGVDHVINHHKDMKQQLNALGIQNISHVISLTHTEQHFDALVDLLAPQGKFALIDDPQGGLDIMKLKLKSISLHWEFMFTRSMFQTHDMIKQHDMLNALADLFDNNIIKPTLGEHFGEINAQNLLKAHQHIESNQAIGKIVLEGF